MPPPVPPPEPLMFKAMEMAIEPKQFIPEYRSIGQFYNNVEAGEPMYT